MKNWSELMKSLSVEDNDNSTDLKVKGGQLLILEARLKTHREDQVQLMTEQTKQSDILDHHKIITIYDELLSEVAVKMVLIEIRLKDLKQVA